MRLVIALLSVVCLAACSYSWRVGTYTNGRKFFYKEYKDYDVEQTMKRRELFKHRGEEKEISIYTGAISSDTIHGSTYIQFDTNRIYLFAEATAYKELFTTGLVFPEMIYCVLDSTCKPQSFDWEVFDSTGKRIPQTIYGWAGNAISIGNIELLTNVKSNGTQRRFEISVRQYSVFDAFFLELTNDNGTRDMPLSLFLKDAHVTFFKKAWSMI